MVQPGCTFLNIKARPPQPRPRAKHIPDDVSSVRSSVKASLLKPPRQLPPEAQDSDDCSVLSLPQEDGIIYDDVTPTSVLDRKPSGDCSTAGQSENSLDPSLQHLKTSIISLREEFAVMDEQLHPRRLSKLSILYAEVKKCPDIVDKVGGQVDTLNFMMSWLATEKRTLEWHLALLGEKVRNLEREVRELEIKAIHGYSSDGDKNITEELWAEFLNVTKEQQQVQARVAVESKIRRRVDRYVRKVLKQANVSASAIFSKQMEVLQAKDPTSFFSETSSLDWSGSVCSDAKSLVSMKSNVEKGPYPLPPELLKQATDDAHSSFEIFGSDFEPLKFQDILSGGGSTTDGFPEGSQVKCFSFNAPTSFKRWGSLHAALARLGSKEEGIGFWLRKGKEIPHEELSDDDSDFEAEFGGSIIKKTGKDNGRVQIKAANPGKLDRSSVSAGPHSYLETNRGMEFFPIQFSKNSIPETSQPRGIGRNKSSESSEILKLVDDFKKTSIVSTTEDKSEEFDLVLGVEVGGLETRRTKSADLGKEDVPKQNVHRYAKSLGPELAKISSLATLSSSYHKKNGIGRANLADIEEKEEGERLDLFEWNRKQNWYNSLYEEEDTP